MAAFIVRIELHNDPTAQEYDNLHKAMEGAGFERTITVAGTRYHLPNAEYRIISTGLIQNVRDKAKDTATQAVTSGVRVLVTEAGKVEVWGLEKA